MMKPVGWEKMNPVQLALFNARFQLAFLHGRKIKLTDDPNYEINNLEYIRLIDEAEEWLKTQDLLNFSRGDFQKFRKGETS